MTYSPLTIAHFSHANGAGSLYGDDVTRAAAGSIELGTWVQFDLRVVRRPDGAQVLGEARFQAFGCPHVIAVADWLAGLAPGRLLEATLPETVQALQRRFDVPVEKLGRLLVVEDAWAGAAGGARNLRWNA